MKLFKLKSNIADNDVTYKLMTIVDRLKTNEVCVDIRGKLDDDVRALKRVEVKII